MTRLLLILLFSLGFGLTTANAQIGQNPTYVAPERGGAITPPTGCKWTGSVAGSCLPSSDTTDQISGPRGDFAGFSDTLSFGASQTLLHNGSANIVCNAAIIGSGATNCAVTTQVTVCATPGNAAMAPSLSHPWFSEGIFSWVPLGTVSYDPHNSGTWISGLPAFSPPITYESTTGSQGAAALNFTSVSYMSPACTSLNGYFVDAILGDMPNLVTAAAAMGSNDTLTVAAQPTGFPFWPTGENAIGPGASSVNPPSNLTVTFDPAAKFGYPNPADKGFLLVENNGTTINNGICYWVNPGNNQACISWDAGLDLTVNNFYGDTAGMGLFRANIRQGITDFTNDTFANMGCMDGACSYGHNHSIYLGTVPNAGFDELFATNLSDPDVLENGWNAKLRTPNSNIAQSFFGARVNNGTSSAHGPIDYPCGGTHAVTLSAMETNQYSLNSGISAQESTFLVSADEERGTNVATTPSGGPTPSQNCPTTVWLPNSTAITATVTGPGTFTTTINPATFAPLGVAQLWDLGASGLLVNGPVPVATWTGPVGGLYTVQVGPFGGLCFNGEGTIPLTHPGYGRYSCFVGTGAITLYATQGALPLLTNTSTTASISVPVNPALVGIAVGDTVSDPTGTLSITSITGSGPYTINMSCGAPAFGASTCLNPPADQATYSTVPVASGTYDFGTGAASLVLGADVGLTNGSSVTVASLYGTGAVSSLNGTFTATAGTGGTTLNYIAATGLTLTIGSSNNGVTNPTGAMPNTMDALGKTGPIQLLASTTGSGCDGVNLLCGIQYNPLGAQVWHGEQVVGTGIATGFGCMTAGQIVTIQPVGGATGSGFISADVGKTFPLVGGTFETAAVATIASVAGGQLTGVTIASGGVYTSFATGASDHKTFTQGSGSAAGTGAQFQFPQPAPIVGGSSGDFTLRLAQASGAACVGSAVTNQVYQLQTPTIVTFDHDLIGWDGGCPNGGPCTLLTIANRESQNLATISNSLVWTNITTGGPFWGSGTGSLNYGMTDGGGNVQCNNRVDLTISPRCAIPPFTAVTFTGAISGTGLGANCAGACMTILNGAYNNDNGIVTLVVSKSGQIPYGGTAQVAFTVAGLTGTGTSLASLNGNWIANSDTAGTTLTYTAPAGLGPITITGGNINPVSGASLCRPGMYVWDNSGQFDVGEQGHTISGTRIVSGEAPDFEVAIPPGGVVTTDIPNTTLSCGFGMPSSAFNAQIDSHGVLTINKDLVGSIHADNYLADIFGILPDNVKVISGNGTVWQTTYRGPGVAAEYMVSVR